MMSRRAARLLAALGVALSIAIPRTSRADDDATIEMARQRFREGVQFYDAHQFEKARLAFLQAYALKPHPSVLLNLAQSELRSGHPDDAASHFSQYLRVNAGATDAERQETNAGFNLARSRVGEVTLTVDPSGAQIVVDGAERGVAPLSDPLYVLPGAHTIEAHAGDRHASKSVTLSAGQSVTIALAVHGSIAAAGAPTAAEAPAAEALPEEEPPPTGAAASEETPPARTPPSEAPEPAPPKQDSQGVGEWFSHTPAAWVLAGVGVVGVGVGVTMALVASHDYKNANTTEDVIITAWTTKRSDGTIDVQQFDKNAAPCALGDPTDAAAKIGKDRVSDYAAHCQQYSSSVSSGDTARTVAIASSVVGAAALVGTLVYYFVDRRPEASSNTGSGFRVRVTPMAGGGLTGIGAFGTF